MRARPLVLVVDPYNDTAAVLARCLKARGFDAIGAADAADGLALATAQRPDAVVLDVGLDIDGRDLAQALRENAATREAALVAFTAHDVPVRDADALGFDAVLQKPADIDVLVVQLERVLKDGRSTTH